MDDIFKNSQLTIRALGKNVTLQTPTLGTFWLMFCYILKGLVLRNVRYTNEITESKNSRIIVESKNSRGKD